MNQRIEQKFEINSSEYITFLKWLNFKNAKIIFPERIICSRYLDTNDYKMFFDTCEGILPRKKVRIRSYGSHLFEGKNKEYNLETKFNIENNRFKEIKSNINIETFFDKPFFVKGYGMCFPKIDISYSREYFILDGIRITIDKDINYSFKGTSNNRGKTKDKIFVVEIKASFDTDIDFLLNNVYFSRTRFSKYERGMSNYINYAI